MYLYYTATSERPTVDITVRSSGDPTRVESWGLSVKLPPDWATEAPPRGCIMCLARTATTGHKAIIFVSLTSGIERGRDAWLDRDRGGHGSVVNKASLTVAGYPARRQVVQEPSGRHIYFLVAIDGKGYEFDCRPLTPSFKACDEDFERIVGSIQSVPIR